MKLSKIFLLAGAVLAFASCSDNDEWNTSEEAVVSMASDAVTVSEATGMFNLPFVVSGERNAHVQVTFEVTPVEESDNLAPAIADEHYLLTSNVINVGADSEKGNLEIITVDDEQVNAKNRAFVVTIVSAKGASIDAEKASCVVTLKDPSPYEAMAGKWTMTTASGSKWNVTVHAAEGDPDYNNVLYVTGMMGYDWTVLTMPYSYNFEEGKAEVYIKAGELFAEGVNFSGIGVCDIYLYNLVDGYLTTTDFAANVSADSKTIDFGAATFTGGLFQGGAFTGYVWFRENGVKMSR